MPTISTAERVRVWRSLKALGSGALRDGAYLLPSEHAALFEPLAAEVREHGGTAMVLSLAPKDDAQRDELLALFDRGVTLLGGTRVTDRAAFRDALVAGESWSACTQKFAIDRDGWPGWRALTGH